MSTDPLVVIEFMDGMKKFFQLMLPETGGLSIVESETTIMVYGKRITWPDNHELPGWHYFPRCNVRSYTKTQSREQNQNA